MDEKKNILKSGGLKASVDFTSKVMEQINAEDAALSKILTQHGMMKPSLDFASVIMTQLEGKSVKKPYSPVISKRTWIGIAAVFVSVICLTFIYGNPSSDKYELTENLQGLLNRMGSLFKSHAIIMYSLTGALLLSIGLVIEQKIGSKNYD